MNCFLLRVCKFAKKTQFALSLFFIGDTPLHLAATADADDAAEILLSHLFPHGWEAVLTPNAAGDTPLHAAAAADSVRVARRILRLFDDMAQRLVHLGGRGGRSPIQTAASAGSMGLLDLMLPYADGSTQTDHGSGEQPAAGALLLRLAMESGSLQAAVLLVERGAMKEPPPWLAPPSTKVPWFDGVFSGILDELERGEVVDARGAFLRAAIREGHLSYQNIMGLIQVRTMIKVCYRYRIT